MDEFEFEARMLDDPPADALVRMYVDRVAADYVAAARALKAKLGPDALAELSDAERAGIDRLATLEGDPLYLTLSPVGRAVLVASVVATRGGTVACTDDDVEDALTSMVRAFAHREGVAA